MSLLGSVNIETVVHQNETVDVDEIRRAKYGSRIVPFCICAVICVFVNLLSLLAMRKRRGPTTVHFLLLYNLAACDLIGSMLIFFYYNGAYFMPLNAIKRVHPCLWGYIFAAPFILSLSSSMLSLLLLGLNQFIAIYSPFASTTRVTKHRAFMAIAFIWTLSLCLAILPELLLFTNKTREDCSKAVTVPIEACAYALVAVILIISALYIKIYRIIIDYRKGRHETIRKTRSKNAESSYKAFLTTLLLIGALTALWMPFLMFHFVTSLINFSDIPLFVLEMKFYFMDFLPMLIFVTDPLIYGLRIVEIRKGYRRLFHQLFPCCVDDAPETPSHSSAQATALRSTSLQCNYNRVNL